MMGCVCAPWAMMVNIWPEYVYTAPPCEVWWRVATRHGGVCRTLNCILPTALGLLGATGWDADVSIMFTPTKPSPPPHANSLLSSHFDEWILPNGLNPIQCPPCHVNVQRDKTSLQHH